MEGDDALGVEDRRLLEERGVGLAEQEDVGLGLAELLQGQVGEDDAHEALGDDVAFRVALLHLPELVDGAAPVLLVVGRFSEPVLSRGPQARLIAVAAWAKAWPRRPVLRQQPRRGGLFRRGLGFHDGESVLHVSLADHELRVYGARAFGELADEALEGLHDGQLVAAGLAEHARGRHEGVVLLFGLAGGVAPLGGL